MTNILLDGFNGRLVPPSETEIHEALCQALDGDGAVFESVCRNAYLSAKAAFSKEKWQERWTRLINILAHETDHAA